MTNKKRRIFINEQKIEVLRIVEQADKPISEVAREIGIGVVNGCREGQLSHYFDV